MNAERRRNERLNPKETTFVVVRPEFSRSGEVLDISSRGLCFQYLRTLNPGGDAATSLTIDIFLISNGYYLPKVPCTLIYDVEEKKGPTLFPMNLEFRRCGLQFGKLSHEQTRQVELYLSHYTVKENGNWELKT
jgi:anaerobic selenocysteine-containing dehydrogenase